MIRMTSTLAAALRFHACEATHKAYVDAENGIVQKKVAASQKEAWHVARLCTMIREMAQDWRKVITAELPELTLSMSSVFTHQRPYVKWPDRLTGTSRCELADLLVAVIDRREDFRGGLAVLVQAKLSDGGQVTLKGPGDETQFDLLSNRPTFDVLKGQGPSQVNLQGLSPDSALLYGLASKSGHWAEPFCGCCRHKTWLAADGLGKLGKTSPLRVTASETFSSVLVGLLQGSYGWKFDLPPDGQDWNYFKSPRDDWSMLINYLLENTFKLEMGTYFNKLQATNGHTSRGKEEPLFFLAPPPNKPSMFLMTDGFSQVSKLIAPNSRPSEGPVWVQATSTSWNGDGGDGGEWGTNPDGPEDGPISAIVIEIGKQS